MPYTVEAAGNGGHGGEEGVGHPNGKDGVLLSDALSGGDVVSRRFPDVSAYGELCPAAGEGHESDAHKYGDAHITVHDGTRGDGNGHGQCYGPEVESSIARVLQALGQARHCVAYSPSQKQRTNESGEYLAYDEY